MASIITVTKSQELFSSPSLFEICAQHCAAHSKVLIFTAKPKKKKNVENCLIRNDLILPRNVWEGLLKYYQRDANLLPLLKEINEKVSGGLDNLDLSNCELLTDSDLSILMKNCPSFLGIHNCPLLTNQAIDIINKFGEKLECLKIGSSSHIIPHDLNMWLGAKKAEGGKSKSHQKSELGLLHTPNLRKLTIWGLIVGQIQRVKKDYVKTDKFAIAENDGSVFIDFWEYLTRQFIDKLEYLDLSGCVQRTYLDLEFLKKAGEHLRVLHLHDVSLEYNESTWNVFQKVKKIKYLDVSLSDELDNASLFDYPDTILQNIVKFLPALTELDLSGTNLAGVAPKDSKECFIKGLSKRVNNPLNFLGLFTTHHNASLRKSIPAEIITGEGTIMQLHTSLKHYLDRLGMCHKVIQHLHYKISSLPENDDDIEDFIPYQSFINLLCKVMRTHLREKKIQLSTSATVFTLMKRIYLECELGDWLLNELFEAVLGLIKVHCKESGILKNSIMILLLLPLYTNIEGKPSNATLLFNVLLTALKSVVKANGTECLDGFFTREAAMIMYSITNQMGSEVEAELQSPNVVPLFCDVLAILLPKPGLFQHVPLFWVTLSQILYKCKNSRCGELLTKGTAKCKSKTGQSLGFFMRYLRLCNDYLLKTQMRYQIRMSIDSLYDAQLPALSLLVYLLVYSSPTCKKDVLELVDGNVQEFLRILESSTPPSSNKGNQEWVLYLTCGILVSAYAKPKQLPKNKKEKEAAISRRYKALTKAYLISLRLNFTSSLSELSFFPLNHLYSLLESDVAPEASYWALKSLLKLVEIQPKHLGREIKKSKTLTSKLTELRERENQAKAQKEVQLMCDRLTAKIKPLKQKEKEFHEFVAYEE